MEATRDNGIFNINTFMHALVDTADQDNTILHSDAEQSNEPNRGRNGEILAGKEQAQHAADQCQGQSNHDQHGAAQRTEGKEEHHKYQDNHNRHNNRQAQHSAALIFELAAVFDIITGRQCHGITDALFNVCNNAAQVAAADITLHRPTPLIIFAIDLNRRGNQFYFSDFFKRNKSAAAGMHEQVFDYLGIGPEGFLVADMNAEAAGIEIELIDNFAADGQFNQFEDFADVDTQAGASLAIGDNLDLGLAEALFY